MFPAASERSRCLKNMNAHKSTTLNNLLILSSIRGLPIYVLTMFISSAPLPHFASILGATRATELNPPSTGTTVAPTSSLSADGLIRPPLSTVESTSETINESNARIIQESRLDQHERRCEDMIPTRGKDQESSIHQTAMEPSYRAGTIPQYDEEGHPCFPDNDVSKVDWDTSKLGKAEDRFQEQGSDDCEYYFDLSFFDHDEGSKLIKELKKFSHGLERFIDDHSPASCPIDDLDLHSLSEDSLTLTRRRIGGSSSSGVASSDVWSKSEQAYN
jgi:hypothetical protein